MRLKIFIYSFINEEFGLVYELIINYQTATSIYALYYSQHCVNANTWWMLIPYFK